MALVLSIVDCEALRLSWAQQPVNAWSSLAFIAVGGAIALRGTSHGPGLIGGSAFLVGIGSLFFHGDDTAFSGWVHDWSIAVLLLALAWAAGGPTRFGSAVVSLGAIAAAALLALQPDLGEWVHAVLAFLLVVREGSVLPSRRGAPMGVAVGLLGAGAVLTLLGRTAGPWCDPESLVQPQAGWHVLGASALVAYAYTRRWLPTRPRVSPTTARDAQPHGPLK